VQCRRERLRTPQEEDLYTEFYGMKEVAIRADTRSALHLLHVPSHTEVMANLPYGIESCKGLMVVTGEVGTARRRCCACVMQRLDRTVMVAYIFQPATFSDGVLSAPRNSIRHPEVGIQI